MFPIVHVYGVGTRSLRRLPANNAFHYDRHLVCRAAKVGRWAQRAAP